MMDKLVLKVYKSSEPAKRDKGVIRITSEAYDILSQLQRQSGLTVMHIASEMIKFAGERCEIKEV